jgi:serine/threonine protein kinase
VDGTTEGTPFGRYHLIELLGRGGMGEVWRAHDPATGRVVAVKVLPAHLAQDKTFQERFRREAYAAAALNEPHVIPIHNFGEIDGRLYVDMRLVEGRDLQAMLEDGPLEPRRAVTIIEQVAAALDAAHHIGLVHRDVKPSNILVAKFDFAYLIDFGIALVSDQTGLTTQGSTLGTWAYMAPERMSGREAGPPADIYALTCVLYECLTGKRVFGVGNLEHQVASHLTQPPPQPSLTRPGVPASFDAVIAKGMAKDPHERFQSTMELAQAARAALSVPDPVTTGEGATTVIRPNVPPAVAYPGGVSPSATTQYQPWGRPSHQYPGPPSQPSFPAQPPYQLAQPPRKRRTALIVTAIVATVAVVAAVVAIVTLSRGEGKDNNANGSRPGVGAQPTEKTKPPGPIDGAFTAEFGAPTDMLGRPYQGTLVGEPNDGTWTMRSSCPKGACIATTTLTNPQGQKATTLVFDEIDGQWVAVALRPGKCFNVDAEVWSVFALKRQPDGSLAGQYTMITASECASTQTVKFAPTGEIPGVEVADPDKQPARGPSRAEALRGQYRMTIDFPQQGTPASADFTAQTNCLRAGDRCVSLFYGQAGYEVLVYERQQWIRTSESNAACKLGGTQHRKITAYFPMPSPPQDPIQLLTGHGTYESTGSACTGGDIDQKFERIGN